MKIDEVEFVDDRLQDNSYWAKVCASLLHWLIICCACLCVLVFARVTISSCDINAMCSYCHVYPTKMSSKGLIDCGDKITE